MKRLTFLSFVTILLLTSANAQKKKEQDQRAIKSMCGCFEVGFNFAETFSYTKDSTYTPSKVKHDSGLEWVQLVEENDHKIVMQHLLIVGEPDEPRVIKHWRQDWLFENTDLYVYDHNNKWSYVNLPRSKIKGQWTQKVFQVDDSPRYEGSATWVHVDGKSYWENTTSAPLPRREYTKRDDYNVTVRTNKHSITKQGWIHNQDNDKVIRKVGKNDFILAQEKGFNTYIKIEDSKCKAAQDWWEKNEQKWSLVRIKWDDIFNNQKDLILKDKVDEKPLYKHLFAKGFEMTKENINKTLHLFVQNH